MYLGNLLLEKELGEKPPVESVFELLMKQVFSNTFYPKVFQFVNKAIIIKEKAQNTDDVAWTIGGKLYINKPQFYSLPHKEKLKILLHELIHLLINDKSILVRKNFKELQKLSIQLWKITKKYSKDIGMFLIGKPLKRNRVNYQEPLAYLMNNEINWQYINPIGKKIFINTLTKSNLFNLNSDFWKERLS